MKSPGILFTPVRIGNLEIKNRIVMPPMGTSRGDRYNRVTQGSIDWYEARARGGVGLIIVEITGIVKRGLVGSTMLGIWDDDSIPGFKKLVKAVHKYDTKIFIQLAHGGRQSHKAVNGGQIPVAPSAISCPLNEPRFHEIPHELTFDEIETIIKQFAEAAGRARAGGFDGIEIHGAHGYLISEFMSPYSNKRHDAYGGTLQDRMEFPLEIIKSVRREVGKDYPVSFRFSANEYVPDGHTIKESKRVARILEAAGVDCLHISGGVYESFWSQIPPHGVTEGIHADDAAAIKKVVNIPVIAVGRIKSPEVAEEILEQKKADMVAIGRQLICDPDWAEKVKTGNHKEIRYCIGCTQSCINRQIVEGKVAACIYNTSAGIEREAKIIRAKQSKEVLVVGGGPGGLEAARVAALRGHKVVLYEKSGKLGGRFNLASVPPFKQEFALAIKWLSNQAEKLGVDIKLGQEVTPEVVRKIKPDAVILATGAVTRIPGLTGMKLKNVVVAEDILAGKVTLGNRVVILGGGGVGCETADFIAQRGKEVTIVEALPEIGMTTGIPLLVAQLLIPRLLGYRVKMITGAKLVRITDKGAVCNRCGEEVIITDADQIVIAMGARSINDLAGELKGKVSELYVIGDAREPRTAFEATREGAEAARKI